MIGFGVIALCGAAALVWEIFLVFLKLGLTSFGGPVAHLGYYRREFVQRRGWLDESSYAQLVSLCQLLPGPASSQFCFALGLRRGGWWGAIAAFVGFTLPSALLLYAFALASTSLDGPFFVAAFHGLKLLTVSVVAHAVLGMARTLTPDAPRIAIGIACAALALGLATPALQPLAIVAGAAIGLALRGTGAPATANDRLEVRFGARTSAALVVAFACLLALSFAMPAGTTLASLAAAFYRAGALVFGGGHVVLPLLREAVVDTGALSSQDFLTGYGAAQLVPGPVFAVAAFLGARIGGALAATVAIIAIFLPGFLLVAAALPWWQRVLGQPSARRAVAGANAAVTGLLAAALYDPVWRSAIGGSPDVGIAAVGFGLLCFARLSVLWAAAWCVGASLLRATLL